ncbi:unnamed protein product [Sphagnum jensenii]|uniref:Uncharacterized protein n=1 Tax=Sphagnum jensenii TaxID=128206 RepID=A0ABP0WAX0_9BRYO
MATFGSLQLRCISGVDGQYVSSSAILRRQHRRGYGHQNYLLQSSGLRSNQHVWVLQKGRALGQGAWGGALWSHLRVAPPVVPQLQTVQLPIVATSVPAINPQFQNAVFGLVKIAALVFTRSAAVLQHCPPLVMQSAPGVGLILFSIWGLGPSVRLIRRNFFKRNDRKWLESQTHNIMLSYMRPVLLWIGIILICRAFDPVVLATEESHAIKQRFVNFVQSLATVLAFAFCTASLTQQVQKFMMDNNKSEDSRNVGIQFIGNSIYASVWVAAVCLFMELLGFSTQKWITAGGFGTVLLTLAGREIFTNFLSSVMIHATRPFVENEWIQTKIEGQEVSGTVEHVGWWSPTVIRGDDREAVHIPNHKFSVNVVRNLTQKTHWRIKTHFGISHLDVNKITAIVSDMRKILAKHPHVEQQRLHRRVFFDNIEAENQALLILVSCFVKTPHFEEYLRVKEIILLDLLKVISHHNARLATPIRSVQRILDENEQRGSPFRDIRRTDEAHGRPFLLIEAQAREDDDDMDDSDDISDLSADHIAKAMKGATTGIADGADGAIDNTNNDLPDSKDSKDSKSKLKYNTERGLVGAEASGTAAGSSPVISKPPLDGLDSMGLNPNDITLLGAALKEKPPAKIQEGPVDAPVEQQGASFKHSTERPQSMPPSVEENLVLGVALNGPKRSLSLDDELSTPAVPRELLTSQNGNGVKDQRDPAASSNASPVRHDARD